MNNLSEVKTIRDCYTWRNNQARNDRIYYKIDRFLANTSWLHSFSNVMGEVYPKGVFDHFPKSLDLACPSFTGNTLFKFLNVLIEHQMFPDLIHEK